MATAQQLKALIASYADGDRARFLSVAAQISAHAAKSGNQKLADELLKLVDSARRSAEAEPDRRVLPIAQPTGELSGLVSASFPKATLDDMILTSETRFRLDQVLREYRQADLLAGHGLSPRRKLLLLGPPGCGKTMTATALAGELHLPLLTVQFHTMITKYLGESAAKLRLVFDMMCERRGVYLFDEFDAIASQRHGGQDVGEIRRVLNAFLVFIESDNSQSLLIAASNLAPTIDAAVFRRFDDVLTYDMPTGSMVRDLIERRLGSFLSDRPNWKRVGELVTGLSHAEIIQACDDAAKEAVLDGRSRTTTSELHKAIERRQRLN